jgi:hypothetical protein
MRGDWCAAGRAAESDFWHQRLCRSGRADGGDRLLDGLRQAEQRQRERRAAPVATGEIEGNEGGDHAKADGAKSQRQAKQPDTADPRFGGLQVSLISFVLEGAGLLLIWQADSSWLVDIGAFLTGGGACPSGRLTAPPPVRSTPAPDRETPNRYRAPIPDPAAVPASPLPRPAPGTPGWARS